MLKKCKIKEKTKNIIIILLSVCMLSSYVVFLTTAASKDNIVDLRIVFTTDLHGQINSMDYETGKSYNTGGLSKAYTLIKQARNQKPEGNTLTFDLGDVLYDYNTEFIFGEDQSALQPIYKAMAFVGYDAMILGNHDYDYGYDYITRQMILSGLDDIVITSNVWEADTGESMYQPYMFLEREVETKSGMKETVKIGLIGESIPNLSSKTSSYTGILKTEDMVLNVSKRASQLKEMGADIIIVLAHTGIGPENPEENYKNVGYALTKIDEVDVVLCGHEHNMFPTPDNKNNAYYKLPGVDADTGLVNGKTVVMASDRGKSIGVVDLTLTKDNEAFVITSSSSQVRKVDSLKTKEDADIKAMFDQWESKILEQSKKVVGTIASGSTIHNYFGMIADNTTIQMLNNAKMGYALASINTINKSYKDLPVIAVSKYNKYGQGSASDYVNLKGEIVESQLSSIQMYNSYLHLYKITGKQLKEWLEWSASAYEYIGGNEPQPLLKEDWIYDWESFYVFDGIYYEISPDILPRYNKNGVKINNTKRITKLLYNGKEIADSMEFVIASDKITKTTQATANLDKQQIQKGFIRGQMALSSYVEQLGETGNIDNKYDNNWKVVYPQGYKFIAPITPMASSLVKEEEWYINTLEDSTSEYQYHVGSYDNYYESNASTPNLIIVSTNKELTNNDIDIKVSATDASGINKVQYLKGDYNIDSYEWSYASEIKDNFSVSENGIYSVLATSNRGQKVLEKIKISNINKGILQAPKVDKYTNKKAKITGTAEPNSTIYFEVGISLYEAEVDSEGKFSYALPSKNAGTIISAYVKDSTGRTSDRTRVTVKRTGPNRLTLNKVTNNKITVSGNNYERGFQVFAIINDTVYVNKKDGKDAYKSCKIFDDFYQIEEVKVNTSSNKYSITIPVQRPGTKITVYAIDHAGRVSRKTSKTVQEVAPNPPLINEVCNVERYVEGKAESSGIIYGIIVEINGLDYTGDTDENGNYKIKVGKLNLGDIIKVYATDIVEGTTRQSYYSETVVQDVLSYDLGKYSVIELDSITTKSTSITGVYEAYEKLTLIIGADTYELEADGFGDFDFELDEQLVEGTKVHVIAKYDSAGIIDAKSTIVTQALPSEPEVLTDLTNDIDIIEVAMDEEVTVCVVIDEEVYKVNKYEYTYDDELDRYIYSIKIPKSNAKTEVAIYAENEAGKSKTVNIKVTKLAPNSPKVSNIYTDTTIVKGKTDIDAYYAYVSIGKKTYIGDVDAEGKFSVEIPKQKAEKIILVSAMNEYGEGPQTKVTVKKK